MTGSQWQSEKSWRYLSLWVVGIFLTAGMGWERVEVEGFGNLWFPTFARKDHSPHCLHPQVWVSRMTQLDRPSSWNKSTVQQSSSCPTAVQRPGVFLQLQLRCPRENRTLDVTSSEWHHLNWLHSSLRFSHWGLHRDALCGSGVSVPRPWPLPGLYSWSQTRITSLYCDVVLIRPSKQIDADLGFM